MTRLTLIAASLSVLGLFGCAEGATFDLTLQVPPPPPERPFVLVDYRHGDADFAADWQNPVHEHAGIDADNELLVTFEASGDAVTSELRVKVRFCADERCRAVEDANAPENRYIFERAFYSGRLTTNRQVIETLRDSALAPTEEHVGKCEIAGEGCRDGTSENHCLSDGRHFCES